MLPLILSNILDATMHSRLNMEDPEFGLIMRVPYDKARHMCTESDDNVYLK